MHYSKLIKKIRKDLNLSTTDFGKKVGLSQSYISQIENNKTSHKNSINIPIDTLFQICNGINYPFRQFLEEAGYIEPLSPLQKLCGGLTPEQEATVTELVTKELGG